MFLCFTSGFLSLSPVGIILDSPSTSQPNMKEKRGVILFLCLVAVLTVLKDSMEQPGRLSIAAV